MFKEYDIVKANRKLSSKVDFGMSGTILIIHDSNPPAYEVEFIDDNGNSIEILTVIGTDLIYA